MSGFSGAVKLGDLDDFINPSQSCVVALNGDKLDLGVVDTGVPEGGEVLLRKRGSASSQIPPTLIVPGAPLPSKPGEAVKVSLSDCLACSGCVTSAETVLLEAQSAEAFKQALREASGDHGVGIESNSIESNGATSDDPTEPKIKAVVVSVSPQSRASLARVANVSLIEAAERITGFFKSIGVARVFDTQAARDISLLETSEEFCERFIEKKKQNNSQAVLPILTSACPGWVCYAEKTHGPGILQHISNVKSPQAVMGTIVKRKIASELGLKPGEIFHATVMPCFDKKLEASRGDFTIDNVPDTDCVLTTGEVAQLVQDLVEVNNGGVPQENIDANVRARLGAAALASAPRAPLDGWLASGHTIVTGITNAMDTDEQMTSMRNQSETTLYTSLVPGGGGGSGGYLDYTFRQAALRLFGVTVDGPLQYHTPRSKNPDLKEVVLGINGEVVLKFAQAYGFRNIQNVVRKIKTHSTISGRGYDFVEIMACPSGCLNGGGQLSPPPAYDPGFRLASNAPLPSTLGGQTAKQLVDELEELYHSGSFNGGQNGDSRNSSSSFIARAPTDNMDVGRLYGEFVRGDIGSINAKGTWHTQYHDRSAEAAIEAGGTAAAAANLKISSDW